VLSGLIEQAQHNKLIHGAKIAPGAPEVTHLLFADDSLFFCRATKAETSSIKDIIQHYQEASGQMVNMEKSELMFSKRVPEEDKRDIAQILPMKKVDTFSKYLGMPTEIGRSKHQVFNYISDRVWKKLKGWKEKKLSFAGRGTLLKAVAQAIPTYIMSCFLLPKKLCNQLEGMACKFWWGSKDENRKIHWVSWNKMCKGKNKGGLGFRKSRAFNEALLAKQGWRIITQPESLVAKLLKAKYFPKCNFMEAKVGNKVSYTWRSILHARWILKKGSYWTIGNGEKVNIWEDNWLPHQNGFKVWSKDRDNPNCSWVKDLIDHETRQWNHSIIDQLFLPFEALQIYQIPLVDTNSNDELTWSGTKDGIYSVKSGYQAVMDWKTQHQNQAASNYYDKEPGWKHLWKLKIPPKHANLIWRILNKAIPVKDHLISRGIKCDPLCVRCNKSIETIDHVFLKCDWVRAIWFGSPLTINFNLLNNHQSFTDWLTTMLENSKNEDMEKIISLIYNIWNARNLFVFQNKDIPVMLVVQKSFAAWQEYKSTSKASPIATSTPTFESHGHNIYWTPPPKNALKLNVDAP
jgi:hypothetical protein